MDLSTLVVNRSIISMIVLRRDLILLSKLLLKTANALQSFNNDIDFTKFSGTLVFGVIFCFVILQIMLVTMSHYYLLDKTDIFLYFKNSKILSNDRTIKMTRSIYYTIIFLINITIKTFTYRLSIALTLIMWTKIGI